VHGKRAVASRPVQLKEICINGFCRIWNTVGMLNVILDNEGFKTSSENINGNSCPEISQKI